MTVSANPVGRTYRQVWAGPRVARHALEPLAALIDMVTLVLTGASVTLIYQNFGPDIYFANYVGLAFLSSLLFVSLFKAAGGYEKFLSVQNSVAPILTVLLWLAVISLLCLTAFLLKSGSYFSRGTLVMFTLAGSGTLLLNRVFWHKMISGLANRNLITTKRVLLIRSRLAGLKDEEKSTRRAIPDLRTNGFNLSHKLEIDLNNIPELHAILPQILQMVADGRIEEIFVEFEQNQLGHVSGVANILRILPVPVRLILDPLTQSICAQSIRQIGNLLVTEIQREPLTWGERLLKRVLDLAIAAAALICLSPLMLFVATLIKLESAGPVFFIQDRNGFSGKTFKIVKFRSMKVLENGSTIIQATQNDARVTKIGRFIRRTSIDELPQLWNVIIGNMSIVGPRPHAVAHNDYYSQLIAEYAFRHHAKPGLTGLSQVRGLRGETPELGDMRQRVETDIDYINTWSIWKDLKIILMTAFVLFRQRRAF
jgi:putative colanic acid biosynthesis UDP-glucose lipid carrier transferase